MIKLAVQGRPVWVRHGDIDCTDQRGYYVKGCPGWIERSGNQYTVCGVYTLPGPLGWMPLADAVAWLLALAAGYMPPTSLWEVHPPQEPQYCPFCQARHLPPVCDNREPTIYA